MIFQQCWAASEAKWKFIWRHSWVTNVKSAWDERHGVKVSVVWLLWFDRLPGRPWSLSKSKDAGIGQHYGASWISYVTSLNSKKLSLPPIIICPASCLSLLRHEFLFACVSFLAAGRRDRDTQMVCLSPGHPLHCSLLAVSKEMSSRNDRSSSQSTREVQTCSQTFWLWPFFGSRSDQSLAKMSMLSPAQSGGCLDPEAMSIYAVN